MNAMVLNAMKRGSAKPRAKMKPLKEFHAKETHDGKYMIHRMSGKPSEPVQEHTAADLNEVQQALEQHLGTPNDGEQEAEGAGAPMLGEGQPGMGGQ